MINLDHTALKLLLQGQDEFFGTGATRSYEFRVQQLKRLRATVKEFEKPLLEALQKDLGKPEFEAYVSEVGFIFAEIDHTLKHLKAWMKPQRVSTPITLWPSASRIYKEPLGRVLIISPWNYPFQLLVSPLVGAMAAGNCAVLKPSEVASHTSAVLATMFERAFPKEYVAVVEGGPEAAQALLHHRFDHIFFTGGTAVAKIVARAAAEHLTPVTLELGGKSPCIVDQDADLDLAARRIVWGKFFNAGQTCVAPDYLLVHERIKSDLLARMKGQIKTAFGEDPATSSDYARIVNERHFDRLQELLGGTEAIVGGQQDRQARYMAPTILDQVGMDHPSMQQEIFGPILPVLSFRTLDEAMATVREMPSPLSLYLFTKNEATQERVIRELPFGGGCMNDTLVHFNNPNLPFGGVAGSGMGGYHGKHSFDTFSHRKSVVTASGLIDIKLRYQPYLNKLPLLKRFLG